MLDVDNETETAQRVRRAEDIFETYGPQIRAMISMNVKEPAMADDLFQNLFLSVVHNPIPPGVERIKSYIYRIITNDAIDESRRTKIYRNTIRAYGRQNNHRKSQESAGNDAIEAEAAHEMLQTIKKRLPSREAQALLSRHFSGREISECAREMNVDIRTFSQYLSRGKRRIRRLLRKNLKD